MPCFSVAAVYGGEKNGSNRICYFRILNLEIIITHDRPCREESQGIFLRSLEESSTAPRGKLVEKMHQRTCHKDNCFGYADKILSEPQKNVDEWENRCYDLNN